MNINFSLFPFVYGLAKYKHLFRVRKTWFNHIIIKVVRSCKVLSHWSNTNFHKTNINNPHKGIPFFYE